MARELGIGSVEGVSAGFKVYLANITIGEMGVIAIGRPSACVLNRMAFVTTYDNKRSRSVAKLSGSNS